MTENLSALLYLVASVCFIMALRGLSSPETSRQGNFFGIAGMAIAILTTLASPLVESYWLIVVGIAIGGCIGAFIARKIEMTALPQLVAAFHSLVGLSAVCVAAAAFYAPGRYGILEPSGAIHTGSLLEMGLGTAIGAITFTGSIIAFAKLQALITGRPLVFPGQHMLNLALGVGILVLLGLFMASSSSLVFWLLVLLLAGAGLPADPADRRRRHAGRDLDAEQLFRLGRLRHRLHARRTAC